MFSQSLVVGVALLEAVFKSAVLKTWLPPIMFMAACFTVVSGVQYVAIAVTALTRPPLAAAGPGSVAPPEPPED
jgi:hypothetical protein